MGFQRQYQTGILAQPGQVVKLNASALLQGSPFGETAFDTAPAQAVGRKPWFAQSRKMAGTPFVPNRRGAILDALERFEDSP